jgi:protein-S-isoprenylcysteine O-methyltransferase Ste14
MDASLAGESAFTLSIGGGLQKMTQYTLLVIVWITWCALHSALVSLSLTEPLRKRFPDASRYYRIVYNVVSVVTLLPVLLYTFSLRGTPIFSWQGPWRFVQMAMAVSALVFFLAGARHYDLFQFLGLRQLKDEKACSVLTDDCSLDTSGVLSLVRHPWYAGGILIIWARPLDTSAILTNFVLTGYFVVGTRLEERKLTAQFGQEYADYQQRVSMFLPLKWMDRCLRKKV